MGIRNNLAAGPLSTGSPGWLSVQSGLRGLGEKRRDRRGPIRALPSMIVGSEKVFAGSGSRRIGRCCIAAVMQRLGRGMERWSPRGATQNRASETVRSPKTIIGFRSITRTIRFFQHTSAERQCPRFRRTMGPSVSISQ